MSDKNMDDLLAQIKNEFEPKQESNSNSNSNKPARKSPPPQSANPSASMEQMLAELRADLESGRGREEAVPNQPATSAESSKSRVVDAARRDRLNALIDTDYRRQAHKREEKLAAIQRQKEAELAEIKRQEATRVAEEKRHQQELIEIQKREELRERRRKEALREDAKEWLAKLNPKSEEGKWFQEFSYSYEDKLKAAIDYLEAMRETGL